MIGASTLNVYRNALKDLYRRQEIPLPETFDLNMGTSFSGLKRMQVAKYQYGAPRESGKDTSRTHYTSSLVVLRFLVK
ncbi:hypothetical protein L914_08952, partial [Phytophthora nicotianae]